MSALNRALYGAVLVFGALMAGGGGWGLRWVTRHRSDILKEGRRLEELDMPVVSRCVAPRVVLFYRLPCLVVIFIGTGVGLMGLAGVVGLIPLTPEGPDSGPDVDRYAPPSDLFGITMMLLGCFYTWLRIRHPEKLYPDPSEYDGPLGSQFARMGKYVAIVLPSLAIVLGLVVIIANR